MKEHSSRFRVDLMARNLKVSVSGYYSWKKRTLSKRKQDKYELVRLIEDIHKGSRENYGSPRVLWVLKGMGKNPNKSTVERLMRENGLYAKKKRKFKHTTDSKHHHPIANNILNRDFQAKTPNSKWAGDITYIWTDEGWLYLAILLDLFSRKVVGWAMEDRINQQLTLSALRQAIAIRKPSKGLLHHSDRGSQYAAQRYQNTLKAYEMVCSMSRKANCWDNSVVESFFHTLKTEFIYKQQFKTRKSLWLKNFEREVIERC